MRLLAGLVLVLACTSAQSADLGRATELVRDELMDPFSAQFKAVRPGKGGNVCGLVNAKNAMGGYVGWTPFVVVPSGGVLLRNSRDDAVGRIMRRDFDKIHPEVCPP